MKYIFHIDAIPEEISKRVRGKLNEKGCNCGRKQKVEEANLTSRSSCNNSRCPCFTNKVPCSRICRCKGCGNPQYESVAAFDSPKDVQCSCHKSPVSCQDTTTRKAKCPCLRNGKKCSSCKCKNCGNGLGNDKDGTTSQSLKRKRHHEPTFKRSKGCDCLAQQGFEVNCGTWTDLESVVLIVILGILEESPLQSNTLNASSMYRHLILSSVFQNSGLTIEQKRNTQIAGKILHMRRNLDIHIQMLDKESGNAEKA